MDSKNEEKTILVAQDETTVLAKEDSKTQLAVEDEKTALADNAGENEKTVLAGNVEEDGLEEITQGDIVDGYEIGKIINETSGESVIRICVKDKKQYVIKIFNAGREIDENLEDTLIKAAETCPYIVPILSKGTFKGRRYEIIPFYKNGTTFDHRSDIDNDFLRKVFVPQMNEALQTIHQNEVFHNDFKPSNVFISDDWKSVYLGDFGISNLTHGRDAVTNIGNFSRGYAAPEASRISNAKTDYYSFGVSLLVLCPGNPYAGASELEKELLVHGVTLPDTIDSDLADLIYLLSKFDPSSRIGYDGVKKWIEKPDCYKGVRSKKEAQDYYRELPIQQYKFTDGDGTKKVYYDGLVLADALAANPKQALVHFKAGFLLDIYKNADQELGVELQKISKKNAKDPSLALSLFLRKIKPSLPLVYGEMKVNNLSEYVAYIFNNYDGLHDSYFSDGIIESLMETSNLDKKANKIWRDLVLARPFADRKDTICNLFRTNSTFYRFDSTYESFGQYLVEEFQQDESFSRPKANTTFKSKTLSKVEHAVLETVLQQDFGKNPDVSLDVIIEETDAIKFAFKAGKLYLGYLPFYFMGKPIKNLHDLVDLVESERQNPSSLDILNHLIGSDIFSDICENENEYPEGLVEELKKTTSKSMLLYYLAAENPTFLGSSGAEGIAEHLANEADFGSACETAWNSGNFEFWMLRQGFRK